MAEHSETHWDYQKTHQSDGGIFNLYRRTGFLFSNVSDPHSEYKIFFLFGSLLHDTRDHFRDLRGYQKKAAGSVPVLPHICFCFLYQCVFISGAIRKRNLAAEEKFDMVSSGKEGDHMTPTGGISLIVHVMINTFFRLMKYPKRALPFLVIFGVTAIIFASGRSSIVKSLEADSNIQLLQESIITCKPVVQAYSENKVVLRVDDIQANAYQSMTEFMIKDAKTYNMRLVLGIIPRNFLQDKKLVRFIKRNSCNLEAALHGWGHFSNEEENLFEFEEMEADEARSKIQEGKKILEDAFSSRVVTFIPPGNEISDATKEVLSEEGIQYVSTGYVGGEFDMTAGTFDFPSKSLVSNDEILKRCEAKFEIKEPCIIVMHPQDYMTDGQPDSEKYRAYISLLDELRKRNVYSVTFSDLELQKRQSTEQANLFQTIFHPFPIGSTGQICLTQASLRIPFYL